MVAVDMYALLLGSWGRFAPLHRSGFDRHYYNDVRRRRKVTVEEREWLVERFEEHRARLRAVAYRMLGSTGEADDAVQEAWLRLARSDASGVENLGGWLTTVVARVCLDALRSRASRREVSSESPSGEPPTARVVDSVAGRGDGDDPEREALVADSVCTALLVVLETLTPAERVAFVLHDVFAVPFAEIAPVVGRSPNAAKMLASRARRRVREGAAAPEADPARKREIVGAFLAASRQGDFEALLALLDPGVVLRADDAAARAGAQREARGARAVAETFSGRALVARPALLDGVAGAVWASGGRPRVVFDFTIARGKIVEIDLIADPERLGRLDLTILDY
jgi:RNA polymerase sigma factor (sigma-70 family)